MDEFDGSRIYFSPCGIGLGHVGRSYPIAQELKHRGADILFSTYYEGLDYVKKLGFPVVSSPAMRVINDSEGQIDLRSTSVKHGLPAIPRFLHQMNVEMEYLKAYHPHVVVSDTRLSSVFAAKMLGIPVVLILNQFQPVVPRSQHNFRLSKIADGVLLTLIGRGWAASDQILIPDFPEPYTISLESLRIPKPYRSLVQLVGSILPIKPSKIGNIDHILQKFGVEEKEKLIFAAISGPQQERLPLISRLLTVFESFPSRYKVVMSMGMPNGGSEPNEKGNLIIIPWIYNRFECLKACDLVISRAGHGTIMQSICFGKPQILIPTPGHTEQYSNSRRAVELGVAKAIHQSELSAKKLLEYVEEIADNHSYRTKLQELTSRNNIGDGVENSIEAIGKYIKR